MLDFGLKGKKIFIAGIGDDRGYGWAIAKALAEAGAEIIIGTWVPLFPTFLSSWQRGKLDASRTLSDGSLMRCAKFYPIDATFDHPEEVPEDLRTNKRYQNYTGYTCEEVARTVEKDFGKIDGLVHSLANSPEIKKPLLETSRRGYLDTMSASSYSLISLLKYFGPNMHAQGSVIDLTYLASTRVIPGYGGGMSAAKAALESDTRTLAWEMGRKWGTRINAISAGALNSRAARAIGLIEKMIEYARQNAPLQRSLKGEDVGHTAAFLLSSLSSAITGVTLYVDNGMHAMGMAVG